MPINVDFQCRSGDYSDCLENIPEDVLSETCSGILMFSNQSTSCGANCGNIEDSRKIVKKGWTLFTRYFLG